MGINKRIIIVLSLICIMLLSIIGYLTYFTLFMADAIAEHPLNRRYNWVAEEKTLRGSIFDTNGVVLAKSSIDEKSIQTRQYPYGGLYAHVIGYNSEVYGKSQLEKSFNNYLLGKNALSSLINIGGEAEVGYDLTLTIDHSVQTVAMQKLNSRNGAAVAINPQNGEVLAMVSFPTFDPNDLPLTQNWEAILNNPGSPFLPRATSGLYAPGSTFKIITSTAILNNNLENEIWDDTGTTTIDGKKFKNFNNKSLGKVDLAKAFAQSSNVAFCNWGAELGSNELAKAASAYGFEKSIDTDIPTAKSSFQQTPMTLAECAASAIGQGATLATPLQMAKVAGIVANGGQDIPIHIVKKATSQTGAVVYEARKSLGNHVIASQKAQTLKDLMVGVVKNGTATGAAISGVQVAGKTGTAENEKEGKEHAWFIGFAPAENPTVAVAVIVEYSGGTGSDIAVPIARDIIRAALSR